MVSDRTISLRVAHVATTVLILHKKRSFPLRISSVNLTKSAASVTFTEKILYGKLHFCVHCIVGHLDLNANLCLNESIATCSNISIATVANFS